MLNDGNKLIAASNGKIKLINYKTGNLVNEIRIDGRISSIKTSSDDEKFLFLSFKDDNLEVMICNNFESIDTVFKTT